MDNRPKLTDFMMKGYDLADAIKILGKLDSVDSQPRHEISSSSRLEDFIAGLDAEIAQLRMENFALKEALEMAGATIETYGEWRVIKEEGSI